MEELETKCKFYNQCDILKELKEDNFFDYCKDNYTECPEYKFRAGNILEAKDNKNV